jgi:DNA-binding response OmpR family regulator
MKKILLAEDDIDFASVLKQYLEIHQFEVHWAKDGDEARNTFRKEAFDICIFDVMMPKMDGFTLAEQCVTLRPEIPFLFLTARNQNEDKIKGLKLGADDYIIKPFEADELVLRITNILKRASKSSVNQPTANEIQIGRYLFHTYRLELKLGNKVQQLTEKEAALITFLFHNKNQLLKRDQILQAIWKTDDYFSGRSMDVFISRLRKYFKDDNNISIESVRNIGLEFKIKKADL